jgi:hypothetical protein
LCVPIVRIAAHNVSQHEDWGQGIF